MAPKEPTALRLETLGGLAIARGGEPVADLASSKAEALLVYLACTRREHPRERLAELLWDERTRRQALANLCVRLSNSGSVTMVALLAASPIDPTHFHPLQSPCESRLCSRFHPQTTS